MEKIITRGQMKTYRAEEAREKLLLAQQLLGTSRKELRAMGFIISISKEGILTMNKAHYCRTRVFGFQKVKQMLKDAKGA